MLLPLPQPDRVGERPDRDHATLAMLQAGDVEGLRRLLIDHAGPVLSLLRREFHRVLDEMEIQDAIARATERAWRRQPRLAPDSSLRSWFYVIARNRARRLLEERRRYAALQLIDLMDCRDSAAAPQSGESELVRDVRRCIAQLPPLQREVMLADLRAEGTAAAAPLADALASSISSIYAARSLGRKALLTALEKLGHALAAHRHGRSQRS